MGEGYGDHTNDITNLPKRMISFLSFLDTIIRKAIIYKIIFDHLMLNNLYNNTYINRKENNFQKNFFSDLMIFNQYNKARKKKKFF